MDLKCGDIVIIKGIGVNVVCIDQNRQYILFRIMDGCRYSDASPNLSELWKEIVNWSENYPVLGVYRPSGLDWNSQGFIDLSRFKKLDITVEKKVLRNTILED
jgi:hypothetical protein